MAQCLIAVNHFSVIIVIIQQFLKCKCHAYYSTEKGLLVVYSVFAFVLNNCDNVQGKCKCGSSAEKAYNIISIFLVKSLKKLLVRQKMFLVLY